ncbi:hypothetical protein OROHE_014707 [Orobanche hederae]
MMVGRLYMVGLTGGSVAARGGFRNETRRPDWLWLRFRTNGDGQSWGRLGW